MIASGKHPYAVLNISIPPKELDVNVHPAKREVKYTNPNLIFNFVYSSYTVASSKVSSYSSFWESPLLLSDLAYLRYSSEDSNDGIDGVLMGIGKSFNRR